MLMNKVRIVKRGAGRGSRQAMMLAALLLLASALPPRRAINLSPAETRRIGKKIWQNECNGTVAGLTSWNAGENFASLGIGHFIWYPKGAARPVRGEFSEFVSFAGTSERRCQSGCNSSSVIQGPDCPWNSRAEFHQASQTVQMKRTAPIPREDRRSPGGVSGRALAASASENARRSARQPKRATVQQQFDRVADSPSGCYALVDYVNFKGEGVLATERYAGQGWGLLQVLEGMSQENSGREAVKNFAESAKKVLTNRVHNAPPERNESRWLPGWLNRINTYRPKLTCDLTSSSLNGRCRLRPFRLRRRLRPADAAKPCRNRRPPQPPNAPLNQPMRKASDLIKPQAPMTHQRGCAPERHARQRARPRFNHKTARLSDDGRPNRDRQSDFVRQTRALYADRKFHDSGKRQGPSLQHLRRLQGFQRPHRPRRHQRAYRFRSERHPFRRGS